MAPETGPARDALDDKVNHLFAGKVVRKDLVRKVKVGANVPVFVLEYLLGKYAASADEVAIQMGLQVVQDTLANNYIRADELPYVLIFDNDDLSVPFRRVAVVQHRRWLWSANPLPRWLGELRTCSGEG